MRQPLAFGPAYEQPAAIRPRRGSASGSPLGAHFPSNRHRLIPAVDKSVDPSGDIGTNSLRVYFSTP